ncbi:hypothetical protein [uncultured Proteiniphilum sp.]|uniref:hypothetical protein n=1 Tax=uncultured Proteiniphilum sp. TaxID=497637 RepID=UPI00262CEC99|nr:hypothetical protein [uncultured Proteiniphilum sp.]
MIHKLVLAVIVVCMLQSCFREETFPDIEGAASVNINTRGALNPSDPDRKISSLRIMAFDHSTGAIRSNTLYSGATLNASLAHQMHAGLYDFFFVANEPSGSTLDNIASKTGLNAIEFPASAFTSDSDIPMTASYPNVTVLAGTQGVVVSGNTYTDWAVQLTRIAVRFDITLQSKNDLSGSFTGVAFNNIADAVPLIGGYYAGAHATERNYDLIADPGYFEPVSPGAGYAWAMKVKRIILPAHVFSPESDFNRVAGFQVKLNSGINPGCTFSLNDATDYSGTTNYTMPYNYHFTAVSEVKTPLEINLDVAEWGPVNVDGSTISRSLNVSAIQTNLSERSVSRIFFWTDQTSVSVDPVGYVDTSGNTTFNVNDFFTDLAGASAPNLHFDAGTGRGYIDIETDIPVDQYEGQNYSHRIYLNANGLKREITINTTIRPAVGWSMFPYIGTFHRWNETGERLIFGINTGAWTATVDAGDTFVVLDTQKSPDPNINTENAGNAELYQVTGNATTVSGTGDIYFRVGLASKLSSADATPRYARITLTTESETYSLYVRQGEAADYIFKPDETGTGTNMNSRPYARMFSPYNLTDPQGTVNTGAVKVDRGPRGYVFTQFPTQGGYYFQWGGTAAWLHNSQYGMPPNWNTTTWPNYWDSYNFETCPQGYRRPNHGSTSVEQADDVSISEIAQSFLFTVHGQSQHHPQTWLSGYYADGFFDRRLTLSSGSVLHDGNAMVSSGAMTAYKGTLVYHPTTKASIFFPHTGIVVSSYGIIYDGQMTNLLTSTKGSRTSCWMMRFSDSSGLDIPNRSLLDGNSIRCVKE